MALPRRELALFAGAGGGILGGLLLGHVPVCAVEIDSFCRRVLFARQRDWCLPPFAIWDDVRTFCGEPWRGFVDVISGGFPCQNISSAGDGQGLAGEKSGLWREFARIIGEVAPEFVFIENSPHLRTRGLDVVLSDLARMGFDAEWCVLGAANIGAPHQRDRMWILARNRSACSRTERIVRSERATDQPQDVSDANGAGVRLQQSVRRGEEDETAIARGVDWWSVDRVQGVVDGVANRMERFKATGNGQVPGVAAIAWRILEARMSEKEPRVVHRRH